MPVRIVSELTFETLAITIKSATPSQQNTKKDMHTFDSIRICIHVYPQTYGTTKPFHNFRANGLQLFMFEPTSHFLEVLKTKRLQGAVVELGAVVGADGNGVETNIEVRRRVVLRTTPSGRLCWGAAHGDGTVFDSYNGENVGRILW